MENLKQIQERKNNKISRLVQRKEKTPLELFKENGVFSIEAFFGGRTKYIRSVAEVPLERRGQYSGVKRKRGDREEHFTAQQFTSRQQEKRWKHDPEISRVDLEYQLHKLKSEKAFLLQVIYANPPPPWHEASEMWLRVDEIERLLPQKAPVKGNLERLCVCRQ